MKLAGLRTMYEGWARFLIASVEWPDGRTLRREVEDHGSATCVLPYDPQRRTAILVRQFRAPPFVAQQQESFVEAIAGLLESEDPAEGARREAEEEAGLRLGPMESVARAWTMPGISTEQVHLFLAVYSAADRVGPGGGHAGEGEDIEVLEMGLDEIAAAAENGGISDLKTLLLIQALRLRRPELFPARTD